ncbi:hypothetical protein PGH12_00395 [Chryseobacterium wangxinyae]|uniref:hypothetical protein n=1 Tax=Chryseobacterium sp. CY350 TaxID=2997336 RepID=UPI00226E3DE0|nr:hypothetical protein [Chryseobacterium sp. CY350]MCY0977363.1 hypothetical protein [Chryseobacterium sp. CY350]WBZ95618.1 hypothetical protein PGH12_00395 [Chryseobacterium sp. CY350]
MLKQILFFLFSFLLISCVGDFEEKKLLGYSDKNGKLHFEIIEKDFNKNDSLNFSEKRFVVLDSQNRIINKNNSQFLFYGNQNRLQEIRSVYRRGGKTNIVVYKYLYDEKQNLRLITFQFKKVDTIQTFKYNNLNQLIQEDYPFRKFSVNYKYKMVKFLKLRN